MSSFVEAKSGFYVHTRHSQACSNVQALESRTGKVSQLEHVFIPGSKVRFVVIPDILNLSLHAPTFKRLESSGFGVGRGRAALRGKTLATGRGTGGRGAVPPVRR